MILTGSFLILFYMKNSDDPSGRQTLPGLHERFVMMSGTNLDLGSLHSHPRHYIQKLFNLSVIFVLAIHVLAIICWVKLLRRFVEPHPWSAQ